MPGLPPAPLITLATRVTLARIAGIPAFIVLVVLYLRGLDAGNPEERLRWWAFGLFLAIAATDALDGYLARSRNEVSALGRILDPLADKLLLFSSLVLLTRADVPALTPYIPPWFTAIVIARDGLALIGYFLVRQRIGEVHVQPRWTGKVATVLQMSAVLWVLGQFPAVHFDELIVSTAALTAVAGLLYVRDGWKQARTASRQE